MTLLLRYLTLNFVFLRHSVLVPGLLTTLSLQDSLIFKTQPSFILPLCLLSPSVTYSSFHSSSTSLSRLLYGHHLEGSLPRPLDRGDTKVEKDPDPKVCLWDTPTDSNSTSERLIDKCTPRGVDL